MTLFKEHLSVIAYAAINLLFAVGIFSICLSFAINLTYVAPDFPDLSSGESLYSYLSALFFGRPHAAGLSGIELNYAIYITMLFIAVLKFSLPRIAGIKQLVARYPAYELAACMLFLNFIMQQTALQSKWIWLTLLSITLLVCLYIYRASNNRSRQELTGANDKEPIDGSSAIVAPVLVALMLYLMPGSDDRHFLFIQDNHAQIHSPFNMVAAGNLSNRCVYDDASFVPHPNPFFLGIAKEPCYFNRYQTEGGRLSITDKQYLLLLDGNHLDYVIYVAGHVLDEPDVIKLQAYLEGQVAMRKQVDRMMAYEGLDVPHAIDRKALNHLTAEVEREEDYYKEIKLLMESEGPGSAISYIKSFPTNDFEGIERPSVAAWISRSTQNDDGRQALSIERMKVLKDRKEKVDSSFRDAS